MNHEAALLPSVYRSLKELPGISALIRTAWWKRVRHRLTLALSPRRSCHFTCFLRFPTQFDALSGPVLDYLLRDGGVTSVRIAVIGCSTGAEAYSIASVLRARRPELGFTVCGYDIDAACIQQAKSGRYTPQEVVQADLSGRATITAEFANATFDIEHGSYVVKSDLRKQVTFALADVLDPNLDQRIGTADIVYAQNVLLHLRPRDAKRAFRNICRLLNPRAALFIAGIDLHLLQQQTRKHGLVPCDYRIGDIYNEMRAYSGGWPWDYYAREPFMMVRSEWPRRYSTIFFKE
jgi:chemotaxis protein methyltransferase CheR